MGSGRGVMVVAVKEVASAVPKEEWSEDRLLPGDIIERVAWVDGQLGVAAPFPNGKAGLEDELRQMFRTSDVQVLVWVKRAGGMVEEVRASIVPEEMVIPKKHYTLRSFHDFRHIVHLVDIAEDECFRWQEATVKVMSSVRKFSKLDTPIENAKKIWRTDRVVQAENILQAYPWTQKMRAHLPVEKSCMLYSMLFMPFQPSPERVLCKGIEDTTARAMAWFSSAQAAGVPIIFVSIQSELIFKESSKDIRDFFDATSKESIQKFTSCGRFRMACSENTMIDVARAIRLWYIPPAIEVAVDLLLEHGETKFGLSLANNEEGFCYVVEVDDGSASDRAGVKILLELAMKENKLLVVSRVGEDKVVPWLASCDGSIHCYGVPTIREHLSTLRGTFRCARIHLMVWESTTEDISVPSIAHDSYNMRKSNPIIPMDLIGLTTTNSTRMTTPTRATTQVKSSAKRHTVSWSDDNGSHLAIVNNF